MKTPQLTQHKTPCKQCPFRRTALPGWLGGFDPDHFQWLANSDIHMNCHTRAIGGIDYEHPDITQPQCAGRAIYWANQYKIPRDRSLLLLPQDSNTVFTWPAEFLAHHKRENNGS